MPKTCVEIEVAEDGSVSVGVEPQTAEYEAENKDYLQPAKSVEDALQTAKDLLSGATGEQAQAAESDMQEGFNGVRGGGLNGQGPGSTY